MIYAQYFRTSKRKGNQDPKFLSKVNGAFICFIATAIRHCLKAWRKGQFDEDRPNFMYETAWCKLMEPFVQGKD